MTLQAMPMSAQQTSSLPRARSRAGAVLRRVFFVLAMQCLATLAVTRRETGRLKYAALQSGYMSALAYVAAFAVFQGFRAAGIG